MSCHKHFLTFDWERHHWRTRVASAETLTISEMNIWCRVVDKDYVRCDKQRVCEVCGTVGRQWSCVCDMEVAERCALRNACLAEAKPA
jgi:hypothetical protein